MAYRITTSSARRGLLAFAATVVVTIPARSVAHATPARADGTFALVAKITIKPGQVARFVDAMQAQVRASRREPGVVDFRVLASASDSLVFYSVESYRDKAAFDAHAKAPNTVKLLAVLQQVQAKDLEAQFLRPLL